MKIAVTGASGFIGQYVVQRLLECKVEVIAITRNASKLEKVFNCQIVEMDIRYFESDCFDKLGRPDVLIHLAWDGLPNYKSLHHFTTELPSQYRFIETMVKNGLSSLFVTGTCFEYGMQSGELCENDLTIPSNPYGYAKDALRQQLQFLQAEQPFNLTWTRLFYMYGENQPTSSIYPQLKEAVRLGQQTFNMSGGEQLRDYLSVEHVANYIVSLALAQQNLGIINICSGQPVSVRNLVETWCKVHNWTINLNLGFYPYPLYEPMAFWGSKTKLDFTLGKP